MKNYNVFGGTINISENPSIDVIQMIEKSVANISIKKYWKSDENSTSIYFEHSDSSLHKMNQDDFQKNKENILEKIRLIFPDAVIKYDIAFPIISLSDL